MENKKNFIGENLTIQKAAGILSCYKEGDALVKAYNDSIMKAEGSRGGKVIGHTKSGKPIYESGNHSHLMTKQDYLDASNKHALIAADKNHEYGIGGFSKEQLAAKAAAKHHEHQANYLQGEADNFVERPDSKEKKVNDKKDLSKMSVEEHDKEIDRLQEIRNNRYIRNDKYNDEDKKANDEAFEQQKIHISHKNALLSKQEDSKKETSDLQKAYETLGLGDLIQKGGMGSGRKLGFKTTSGKDIYHKFDSENHKDFTKQDHLDAAAHHERLSFENDMSNNKGGSEFHMNQYNAHKKAAEK
jgi:hypothetical protein